MAMTRETALEKANTVIATARLDDLAENTRRWLVTDIVNALLDVYLDGYRAGADDQAAKWTNAISAKEASR